MGRVALQLPESLKESRFWLVATDMISAVISIVLCAWLFNATAGAYLFLSCTLVAAYALRRYTVSYAVNPNDEYYAAASVAIPALPCAMVVAALLGQPWYSPFFAAPIWIVLAGAAASQGTALRRPAVPIVASVDHFSDIRMLRKLKNERAIIRALDVVLSSLAAIVAIPIMAVVAYRVAREDGRPIFFSQSRVGLDEREFQVFKVRTMRKEAGEAWVVPADDRVTKIGRSLRKSSLDEVPQLVNVLRGEMSLVGPRPEMRAYAERFASEFPQYANRHLVQPGLTGWAQLYLPRNLAPSDAERVLTYDLFYIANYGVALYLFCLVKTACEIFHHHAE